MGSGWFPQARTEARRDSNPCSVANRFDKGSVCPSLYHGISLSSSSLLLILLLLPLQVSLICQQILTFDFFFFQG
ncbi:hypothetical protein LWI29_003002 [Acer saccharum]|uniref:Uncharacterized protein n=1 Tax=Acer saccharum TaxID=4024 RepID=A0AA39VY45_ACESA|nr:hypothetical protein LWI29_003002 [Acer saccharum]